MNPVKKLWCWWKNYWKITVQVDEQPQTNTVYNGSSLTTKIDVGNWYTNTTCLTSPTDSSKLYYDFSSYDFSSYTGTGN